ncbi:unnamed protein product, partial [Lampetra planeri]
EMVFCEGLSATDFMEPKSTSSTETEKDSDSAEDIGELSCDTAPYTTHEVYSSDRKHTLFSAGIIRTSVLEKSMSCEPNDIDFSKTEVLCKPSGYHERFVHEAIHIYKHRDNFNREDGFWLSNHWKD